MKVIFIGVFIVGLAGTVYSSVFAWMFAIESITRDAGLYHGELAIGLTLATMYGGLSWLTLFVIDHYLFVKTFLRKAIRWLLLILLLPLLLTMIF